MEASLPWRRVIGPPRNDHDPYDRILALIAQGLRGNRQDVQTRGCQGRFDVTAVMLISAMRLQDERLAR